MMKFIKMIFKIPAAVKTIYVEEREARIMKKHRKKQWDAYFKGFGRFE